MYYIYDLYFPRFWIKRPSTFGRYSIFHNVICYCSLSSWVSWIVSSFLIQNFSLCLSPSLRISMDNEVMFINCSVIVNFPCVLKSWLGGTSLALGSLTSFLWLFNFTWNGVSDPAYCILQIEHLSTWHICFCNLMSDKYQIFHWFGCLWILRLCLPVYSTWSVYRNRGNTFL